MNELDRCKQLLIARAVSGQLRSMRFLIDLMEGRRTPLGELEDHRTQVIGELLDALEVLSPGLGDYYHQVLYPLSTEAAAIAFRAALNRDVGMVVPSFTWGPPPKETK